jgi:hypothetical protein
MTFPYLDEIRAGFGRALDAGLELRETTLVVDAETLLLRFAGDALADALLPALAPIVAASERTPGMTVELWDSASAGRPPPPPPWTAADGGPLGAVKGHNDGGRRAIVDPESGTLTIADLPEKRAAVWAPSAADLPSWWRAVPLRMVLDWTLAQPGRHVVHAGAVGSGERGVLLAGPGHAGKSTVAATCVQAGMAYLGDDYVLLQTVPRPLARALYGTARVDRRSLAGLPDIARSLGDPGSGHEKVLLDIKTLYPDRVRPSLALQAVVIPRFAGGDGATLCPVSATAALRALGPSTIFQAPDGGADALRVVADLVRRVPAFELRIGNDLTDVPERIDSLLAGGA